MTEEYQHQIEAPAEGAMVEANADESPMDEQDEVIEPEESGAYESPEQEEVEAVVIEPETSDGDGSPVEEPQGNEQIEDRNEIDDRGETEAEEPGEMAIEMQQDEEPDIDESGADEQIEGEIVEFVDEASSEDDAAEIEEQIEVQSPRSEQEPEPEPEEDIEVTVESVIEAVLFASDEPLTPARLAGIVESNVKQVREHIANLNNKYHASNNAFRIEQIAGGYQMMTLSPFNHWLKKLLRVRSDSKLSPAALETLAIIAYKQPVIRADIEVIRGVATGEVLRGLMYKGLVKIVGRAEVLGRPMLYGTTKKFLTIFGLNSLKDLPKVEELKKPPV